MSTRTQFHVGQIVEHKLFGYRGVVFAMDRRFALTEEWYETMAKSRPPKDFPWYHVLVDNANYSTYVAQRNLSISSKPDQISHPDLGHYFKHFIDGEYQ